MIRPFLPLALCLLATGACSTSDRDDEPVVVSAIGGEARTGDPSRGALDTPRRLLMDATAQGLVRFDGNGQIEAGLAERWIVIDGGQSYIFRLRAAEWPDGSQVTARQVIAVLRRAAAPGSRNALAPFLRVVDEIVEMTPQVIEVRLTRPRPDLLKLFAQPELAIFTTRDLVGSGPFRVRPDGGGGVLLRPAPDPALLPEEAPPEPDPDRFVRLHGERAAVALARFVAGESDLVQGGSFADWPLIAVAGVEPTDIRVDPALGLFGLAVTEREGFLADTANREAVAMALDRAAITGAISPDWIPVETLLPDRLDSAAAPAQPAWSALPLDQRRSGARARVAAWEAQNDPVRLRIALPPGPGANLLWGQIGAALIRIGIDPVRVAMDADADLRLVDAVAPYDSARWMLVTACRACSAEVATLIDAARDAPTLEERSARIAEADAALTADAAFIAIARPLRWAIVGQRLRTWRGNPRAWHPLNHLIGGSE